MEGPHHGLTVEDEERLSGWEDAVLSVDGESCFFESEVPEGMTL